MEVVLGQPHDRFAVSDTSYIGELRRHVRLKAQELRFDEAKVSDAEIVATEIATNLVKFANGTGEVLVYSKETTDGNNSLELISIDNGKGMEDTGQMMIDGQTTSGTMGGGLGAVKRLTDDFAIESKPSGGTIIVARMRSNRKRKPAPASQFDVAGISVALPGETECGDSWSFVIDKDKLTLFVVDGLGHGPAACESAMAATDAFKASANESPANIIRAIHSKCCGTRGAAAGITVIDLSKEKVTFCGVGNIVTRVLTPANSSSSLVCMSGILGFRKPLFKEFECDWSEDAVAIMTSDGLKSSIELKKFDRPSSLCAAWLRRQYSRNNDDSTVLVAQASRKT